jgi:hypothetical protein
MEAMMTRRLFLYFSLAITVFLPLTGRSSRSEEVRLAIGGYDTVAYFTEAKPVPGQSDLEYVWHDTRWRFATPAHRDLFARDPERYAPQYDGYCALGVASGKEAHKDTADPQAWAIVDGKLYLTHSSQALAKWRQTPAENIKQANRDWPSVKAQTVVYDGYPNVRK